VMEKARDILDFLVEDHLGNRKDRSEWDLEGFRKQLLHFFGYDAAADGLSLDVTSVPELAPRLWERLEARYQAKEEKVSAEMMRHYERHILLQIIDAAWKDHLLAMDHLKDGIGLRAYGQRDPLVEYKRESFDMFSQMSERIENDAIRFLFLLEPMTEEERLAEEERLRREEERRRQQQEQIFAAASRSAAGVTAKGGVQTVVHKTAKVGRNDPCPCGSGKKYKQCHGA